MNCSMYWEILPLRIITEMAKNQPDRKSMNKAGGPIWFGSPCLSKRHISTFNYLEMFQNGSSLHMTSYSHSQQNVSLIRFLLCISAHLLRHHLAGKPSTILKFGGVEQRYVFSPFSSRWQQRCSRLFIGDAPVKHLHPILHSH